MDVRVLDAFANAPAYTVRAAQLDDSSPSNTGTPVTQHLVSSLDTRMVLAASTPLRSVRSSGCRASIVTRQARLALAQLH